MTTEPYKTGRVDFQRVNAAALQNSMAVVQALLPGGRRQGQEYVVRNPMRSDKRPGSLKINLVTLRWADFSTGDRGGDPVSLAAWVTGTDQRTAAINLADALGVNPYV